MATNWKSIKGYEGLYEVSACGKVRSLDRVIIDSKRVERQYAQKIRKTFLSNGYEYVNLSKKNVTKKLRVHRLVAFAFVKNGHNKPYVNHKDGNKLNNKCSNLEWVSSKENSRHAVDNGLIDYSKGESHYLSKLTDKKVIEIHLLLQEGLSCRKIAKIYNISKEIISRINRGVAWKHVKL
jgi:transposase